VDRISNPQKQRGFRLTWVGRGATLWKVFPVVKFLDNAILPKNSVELTIFTDKTESYKRLFAQCGLDQRIKILYETGVFGAALRERLRCSSDLHLGMGTSVLEGAAEGIPSICIDPQYDLSQPAAWQWLYEREGFDLGRFDALEKFRRPFDLANLADDLIQLNTLSKLCYEYVLRHHNLSVVAAKLATWKNSARLQDYLKANGQFLFWANVAYRGLRKLTK